MQRRPRRLLLSGVLAAALSAVTACSSFLPPIGSAPPAATREPRPTRESAGATAAPETDSTATVPTPLTLPPRETDGVLRINTYGEPDSIDPQKTTYVNEIQFVMMAYQPLMSFDREMKPIPGAAESVEVSADGRLYTFTLRPDSRYSDGSPLTAADFVYGWQRLADPATAGGYQSLPCGIIRGYSELSAAACQGLSVADALARDQAPLLADFGVRALDERTLEIELTAPAPYFLSMAALWIGAPVRQSDVASGDDWWYEPTTYIGNGPYILKEWIHDSLAVWTANPYYEGPLGPLQIAQIEYYMIPDGQLAFEAYLNGELDMVDVTPEDAELLRQDPLFADQIVETSGSCTFYLAMNLRRPPFDNPLVRQALAQAIDRRGYVDEVLLGQGEAALSFIPPGFPGYQPDITTWDFNPTAARALLAEAGYPNAAGLPELRLTYGGVSRNNPAFEWLAVELEEQLGIVATLDPIDPQTYAELARTDPPQITSAGWCADYPDQQNWLSLFQTNGVLSARIGYSNPAFDQLIRTADTSSDAAERERLYAEAQQLLVEDAPVIFLNNDTSTVLVQAWVRGISNETISPIDYWLGFYNLANLTIVPDSGVASR
jgi:oligopeptide transport system substrate-binding protein